MNKRFETPADLRVVYMGTPAISAIVLKGILDAGFHVVGLICNEDKPVGRKGKCVPPPTKELAMEYGVPVFQPHRIRLDYEWLKDLRPDVVVTMAYGQIVPQGLLDIPACGCLNLHGSLLPALRGAAPIQRAIMQGWEKTGVTLQRMVDKMDAGKMYAFAETEILPSDNFTTLAGKIGIAARDLILRELLPYANGELEGEEQDESQVTFANKIKPEDERIPDGLSCRETLDYIRALSETPGAYYLLNGAKLKVYEAHAHSAETLGAPRTIVSDKKGLFVQCEDGIISLDRVQARGEKGHGRAGFVNGQRALKGTALE